MANSVLFFESDDVPCDFRCYDGSCQPASNRCNGVTDCADGRDEINCSEEVVDSIPIGTDEDLPGQTEGTTSNQLIISYTTVDALSTKYIL